MINWIYNLIEKRKENKLDKIMNKKIDSRLRDLANSCNGAIFSNNFEKAYILMGNINEWSKIRGHKDINVSLEHAINESSIKIIKHYDNFEDGRVY